MTVEILQLSFRLMTEKTFNHSMDASLLISDVKALIESDSEIAPENQRLIFKGQILKDEHTLKSYGVESGSTIHVVGRTPRDPSMESDGRSEESEHQTGPERPEGPQRPFGIPMGIYMSPIYATISVTSSGDPTIPEGTVEQVASNFFSGVMNSFLNTFNAQTATVNTPSPRPTNTVEDELVRELEKSTNTMAKVTRSVKTLNNTRIYQTSSPFEATNEESREQEKSRTNGENEKASSTNVMKESHGEESRQYTENSTENEEDDERTGKVFLIDPESLSSKLPWDSLRKLEQVLSEESEGSLSSCSNSEANSPMSQRGQNKEVSIRTPYTSKAGDPNSASTRGESANECKREEFSSPKEESRQSTFKTREKRTEAGVLEEFMTRYHKFNNHLQRTVMDYSQGERSIQLDRFRRVSYAMSIKTGIDTALSALFIWLQTQMVSPERARAFAVYMGWSPNTQQANSQTSDESRNNETSTYNRAENTSSVRSEGENEENNNMKEETRQCVFKANKEEGEKENNTPSTKADESETTPKTPYKEEGDESKKSNTYHEQDNELNWEMEVDQNHEENNSETRSNRVTQAELLSRYRSNPEFSSSMEKVRKTKLSDTYHNSR